MSATKGKPRIKLSKVPEPWVSAEGLKELHFDTPRDASLAASILNQMGDEIAQRMAALEAVAESVALHHRTFHGDRGRGLLLVPLAYSECSDSRCQALARIEAAGKTPE